MSISQTIENFEKFLNEEIQRPKIYQNRKLRADYVDYLKENIHRLNPSEQEKVNFLLTRCEKL